MLWSTININTASKLYLPTFLRDGQVPFLNALNLTLQTIVDETLYKMQHNGTKIYLEKMLNESFAVAGYDNQNHEVTKLIYIDDIPEVPQLYVWQDLEPDSSFLEDDGDDNENDTFLDGDSEATEAYSWIIYMPDTITFDEYSLRALVDSYRYIGKKYTIEIYTP
jgi:hypothetical protein